MRPPLPFAETNLCSVFIPGIMGVCAIMGVCKDCKPFTTLSVFSLYRWLWSSIVKKFFEGISISQIIAGSLAAVTSFFLAGKIGVAGSTIGAAASYIISTVAGKVYQNVLKASGEKLQAAGTQTDSDKQGEATGGTAEAVAAGKTTDSGDTKDIGETNAEKTTATGQTDDTKHLTKVGQPRSVASNGALSTGTGKNGEVHTFAQMRHHNVKRMAIIVSLISGLVGVAITAGVVLLFTQGKGTDTVVRDMTNRSSVVDKPSDGSTSGNQYGDDDSNSYGYGTDSKKPGDNSTDSSTDSDSSNSSSQNGTKQNSNSGNSTSKNNSGSSAGSGNSSSTGGNSSQSSGSGNTNTGGNSSNSGNSGSSSGSSSSGNSSSSTDSSGSSSGTTSGTDSGSSSGTSGTTGSTTSGN